MKTVLARLALKFVPVVVEMVVVAMLAKFSASFRKRYAL